MLSTLRTIWRTLDGQRLRYGAAIAALVVASCFLYLVPLVPQAVLDGVITGTPEAASAATRTVVEALGGRAFVAANLWVPCLVIVGLTALAGLFTYLRSRWAAAASESIVQAKRDEVYDHLQHLPAAYFDRAETGDVIQRCTSDVETLRKFLATQVVEIGRAVVMLLVPIPLMLAIDVPMTLASLALIPVIVAFSFFFFRSIKAAFTEVDEAEGRMTSRIQENLTGVRVVRAFARGAFEQEQFGLKNGEHRDLDYRLYVLLARFWALSDLLCFLQKGLVVGLGVYWMLKGQLLVGAFFYFITAVNMFIWPVRQMGRILTDLGKAVVALERLEEILAEPVEAEPATPSGLDDVGGEVVFERVGFQHGDVKVLDDVSFTIKAGETLGIVGPSGSGKSTIVNLLLRLYDYEQGSIRIGGRELSTLERKLVRQRLAVVQQQPFLFSKTIGENIRLGRPSAHGADEAETIAAATAACVHEAILGLVDGYDTTVGERGVTLSGGQRQRVALARALLQRPSILILDDALSAVDTGTERAILEHLRQVRARQTTIVIAHRLSTLRQADRILVLEQDGRIAQLGTHAELVEQAGPYQRLWAIQTAPDIAADVTPDTAVDPTEAPASATLAQTA